MIRHTLTLALALLGTTAGVYPVTAQTGATNPHGKLDISCSECHSVEGWKPLRDPLPFQHDKTGFKLVGAHAAVACASCHQGLDFSLAKPDCLSCHKSDYENARTPPHEQFPTTCGDCHQETAWRPARFDHNQTGFQLQGAHRTVECIECHRDGFAGTPLDCFSCHEADYTGAVDPPHNELSTTCQDCHQQTAWQPARFDHNQTAFPLRGAHRTVDCVSCHRDGYAGTPMDCFSCHETDFNAATDPVHDEFPITCQDCHRESAWQPALFDHNQTRFPLRGAHRTVDCATCHTAGYAGTPLDCFSCHAADYRGATDPDHGSFPTSCESCHSETAWQPATFDHSQTAFPLRGAHRAVACADCHRSGYSGTPTDCFSCHAQDYQGAKDPDHTGFPKTCQDCHSESAWQPASFDHNKTAFPLTGAHRTLDCQACHSAGYAGTPTRCVDCHRADYDSTTNPNHQAAGFPTSCQNCHNTSDWHDADFDHNQFFPLSGAHALGCGSCHLNPSNYALFSCIDCHEHNKADTDSHHHDVGGYVYSSDACYRCHPDGRAED